MRVFKVIKTHIQFAEHPEALKGMLGYEFYEYDQTRDRAREFSPEVAPVRDIRYWEKLDDLAYDIKQLIEYMKKSTVEASVAAPASGKTVYLAETTSDLWRERDCVKRELQQHGHAVLPDRELPLVGPDFATVVSEYLARSDLSIHLIGERYGIIPEAESRSVVDLQHELAGRRADIQRVVWMPPGLEPADEVQREFVRRLRLATDGHARTELLEMKLEDLKTIVKDKLADKPKPEPAAAQPAGDRRASLYLICDKQDFGEATELEDYFFGAGLDVTLPASEGDEAQLLEDHKENLLACDAALIYYGRAGELWLRMKQRELQKIAGYGRTAPLLAKGIYIGGPPTDAKERVRDHEAVIIKSYGGFSPEQLHPFLARIERAQGA